MPLHGIRLGCQDLCHEAADGIEEVAVVPDPDVGVVVVSHVQEGLLFAPALAVAGNAVDLAHPACVVYAAVGAGQGVHGLAVEAAVGVGGAVSGGAGRSLLAAGVLSLLGAIQELAAPAGQQAEAEVQLERHVVLVRARRLRVDPEAERDRDVVAILAVGIVAVGGAQVGADGAGMQGGPLDAVLALDLLLDLLAELLEETALCALGKTAANPVMSTINYFREEYDAHIFERHCPAKECRGLFRYEIDGEACKGCGICLKNCPADAIRGEAKVAHVIDQDKCTLCGSCWEKCPFTAVMKV